MDQLELPVDDESLTRDTSNELFLDPGRRPVRHSDSANGHQRYPDIRGFGSARTRSMATPVRWQRSTPFNLMPPARLRLEEGQPDSPLRLLGQVMMVIGVLSFVLAGWYLWGTGILTAGEQSRLAAEFQERLLATSDVTALPPGDEASAAASEIVVPVAWDDPVIQVANTISAELEAIPDLADVIPESAPQPGEALGRIVIPKADVDWIVVEGVTPRDLRNGPGVHLSFRWHCFRRDRERLPGDREFMEVHPSQRAVVPHRTEKERRTTFFSNASNQEALSMERDTRREWERRLVGISWQISHG